MSVPPSHTFIVRNAGSEVLKFAMPAVTISGGDGTLTVAMQPPQTLQPCEEATFELHLAAIELREE